MLEKQIEHFFRRSKEEQIASIGRLKIVELVGCQESQVTSHDHLRPNIIRYYITPETP